VWVTFHHIKQDVLLRIGQIIEAHGAQIAFPTQTLHMHSAQAGGTDEAPDEPALAPAVGTGKDGV
jgi:MscS family membrane protein